MKSSTRTAEMKARWAPVKKRKRAGGRRLTDYILVLLACQEVFPLLKLQGLEEADLDDLAYGWKQVNTKSRQKHRRRRYDIPLLSWCFRSLFSAGVRGPILNLSLDIALVSRDCGA